VKLARHCVRYRTNETTVTVVEFNRLFVDDEPKIRAAFMRARRADRRGVD